MFHIYMLKTNKSHMSPMHVQIDELKKNGVNVFIIMNIISFTQTHTCVHTYTHANTYVNRYT
jgi:hypothetical protein